MLLLVNLISVAYFLSSLHVLMRLKRIHSWVMGQCVRLDAVHPAVDWCQRVLLACSRCTETKPV